MEKEFVPYEQALALKELGFNEPCFMHYENSTLFRTFGEKDFYKNSELDNDEVSAPTFSQAFRWFRDNYNLYSKIQQIFKEEKLLWLEFIISTNKTKSTLIPGIYSYIVSLEKDYKTHEEAELECLKKLIEIVKSKKE